MQAAFADLEREAKKRKTRREKHDAWRGGQARPPA